MYVTLHMQPCKYGVFMVTLKEIAHDAGVSLSTVSAVLHNKEYCYVSALKRSLIQATAEKLGYMPNVNSRALRGLPTKTIGIISSLFGVQIHNELISNISDLLSNRGYQVYLGNSRSEYAKEDNLVKDFASRGVDGIITNSKRDTGVFYSLMPEKKTPVINISNDFENDSKDAWNVSIDKDIGGYMATEHLVKCHGKKRIAFYTQQISSNVRKIGGYRRALIDNGIEPSDKLCLESQLQGHSFDDIRDFIAANKPDAFFASSDEMAFNLIRQLHNMGIKVPDDIAVMGFDGLKTASMFIPSISTVRQPMEILAEKAIERLLGFIENKIQPEAKLIIKPELVIRESCGCNVGLKK